MASTILALATAVPEHRVDTRTVVELLSRIWPRLRLADLGSVGAQTRYLVDDPLCALLPRSLDETMAAYRHHAPRLAESAAAGALTAAGVEPGDVDAVISVSCTGYMVPSLDAVLAARLGFRPDVTRLPITELGCSGGSAALAFAHRHLKAFPEHRVLVVAVELPSLTFHPEDRSLDNITASLVFGDGAAAAVMTGAQAHPRGLRVEAAASHLVPGTMQVLGFDLRGGGFHIVLDRRLPRLLGSALPGPAERFRLEAGLDRLDFVAAHCGGPRVLDAVAGALGLEGPELDVSRATYAAVGNVSSASILFVLEALRTSLGTAPAEGLGLGLGPGLTLEFTKLAWRP